MEATDDALARPRLVELDPAHPGFSDARYRARRDAIARVALDHRRGRPAPPIAYTDAEHAVWRTVSARLVPLHRRFAARACRELARELALPRTRVPQLAEVDARLRTRSGFRMEPVAGLVAGDDFLARLADGVFLSTQYVRHPARPLYTPEPDVIHELVGHAAALAGEPFARLNRAFGRASRGARTAADRRRIDRLYWFTLEFGLVEERGRPRAYGAGLLSSCDELAGFERRARIRPFAAEEVAERAYDPTALQATLYCAPSLAALEAELTAFFARLERGGRRPGLR